MLHGAVLRRGELFGIQSGRDAESERDARIRGGRAPTQAGHWLTGCPIYPVGIAGTDAIQPPDAKMPKLRKSCSITIGRPIKPERYANRGAEHLAWRSMMDEVMFEIREITGQEYVHYYAGEEPESATRVATITDVAKVDPASGVKQKLVASAG